MSKQVEKIKELIAKREQARLGGGEKAIEKIGRASVGKECVRRCRSRWSPYH